jgi:hypothetical protein
MTRSLTADPSTHAAEFLSNNGYQEVKDAVLGAAGVGSLKELSEKPGWGDSYDFLMSLRNGDPALGDYSSPEDKGRRQ